MLEFREPKIKVCKVDIKFLLQKCWVGSPNFDYNSPPSPRFLGRQWKRRRANLGLFRIQPRAPPPAGGFSEFIFVAYIFLF